jgi:sporulation protein YlmC with PRC-barrel domain
VELSDAPSTFSELIGRRVEDGSGHSLGRVFEARGHWQRDGSIVLDELMVGRSGLWERLRGPGAEARGIAWERVAEIGRDRILVR